MKIFLLSYQFGRMWDNNPTVYELVYANSYEEAVEKLGAKYAGAVNNVENCTIE